MHSTLTGLNKKILSLILSLFFLFLVSSCGFHKEKVRLADDDLFASELCGMRGSGLPCGYIETMVFTVPVLERSLYDEAEYISRYFDTWAIENKSTIEEFGMRVSNGGFGWMGSGVANVHGNELLVYLYMNSDGDETSKFMLLSFITVSKNSIQVYSYRCPATFKYKNDCVINKFNVFMDEFVIKQLILSKQ